MGAIDPHDLLKLQAEVEDGSSFEVAAASLGLVSEDDPLREQVLGDLRHELQLFTAPDFDVDVDPERFRDDSGKDFSHGKVAYFLADLYPFATYEDTREVLVYDHRRGPSVRRPPSALRMLSGLREDLAI